MKIIKKERDANFELLRIILIIMVLILHYFNKGMGGALNATEGTNNYYIGYFIESLCIIAVNGFVIITGFFMINKTSIKLDKPINLIFISIFYEVVLYFASIVVKVQEFTRGGFKSSLIFLYDTKWFIGIYVILFCLIPYLNKITENLDKKKFKQLIIILFCFSSVIPTIINNVGFNDAGYGILSFIMLYFIGGYLRLHYEANRNKYFYLGLYFICSLGTTLLALYNVSTSWNYNSILNVISTISLFLFFSKLTIKSNIINYLSKFSFAIYIIHSDASIRTFLYRNIFNSEEYWNNSFMPINMVETIIGIYIGCILIDIIRTLIVKPINNKIKILDKIEISV